MECQQNIICLSSLRVLREAKWLVPKTEPHYYNKLLDYHVISIHFNDYLKN